MQIPCVYIPGPAPAVSVANNYNVELSVLRCNAFSADPWQQPLKGQ